MENIIFCAMFLFLCFKLHVGPLSHLHDFQHVHVIFFYFYNFLLSQRSNNIDKAIIEMISLALIETTLWGIM